MPTTAVDGRSPRAARFALAAAVGLALATRLSLALADPRALIASDVYQDDAFYYLAIARNVVAGAGLTFDGATPTNAFHPLYLGALLPLSLAAVDDPFWMVRASALALALVGVATVGLVYALGRELGGPRVAALGALLFAASPLLSVLGVNGLETGPALAIGVALAWLHVRWRPWEGGEPTRRALAFGALVGLGVLARVDLALLAAVLGVDALRRARARGAVRPVARWLARAAVAAALVWLPWGAVSAFATGAWLPTSGAASREIALQLGWSNLPVVFGPAKGAVFDAASPPLAWRADVAARGALVALLEQPLLAPLRAHIPFGVWPALDRYAPFALLRAAPRAVSLVACLALGALLVRTARPRAAREGDPPSLAFAAVLYAVVVLVAYTLYSPSHWYWSRYLAPSILLAMLAGAAALARWARGGGRARAAVVAVAALALVAQQVLAFAGFRAREVWREPGERGFLASFEALGPHVPAGASLGAFQAGIYGWLRGAPVRNLDGKVDRATQRALAAGRVHELVFEAGIQYVLDQPAIVRLLMLRHAPPAARARFVPVAREARRGGAVLYRVADGPDGAEASGAAAGATARAPSGAPPGTSPQ
ncbi:MAG: glycosyltransferase family 39 protein [Myxococcota bacterium]